MHEAKDKEEKRSGRFENETRPSEDEKEEGRRKQKEKEREKEKEKEKDKEKEKEKEKERERESGNLTKQGIASRVLHKEVPSLLSMSSWAVDSHNFRGQFKINQRGFARI